MASTASWHLVWLGRSTSKSSVSTSVMFMYVVTSFGGTTLGQVSLLAGTSHALAPVVRLMRVSLLWVMPQG